MGGADWAIVGVAVGPKERATITEAGAQRVTSFYSEAENV